MHSHPHQDIANAAQQFLHRHIGKGELTASLAEALLLEVIKAYFQGAVTRQFLAQTGDELLYVLLRSPERHKMSDLLFVTLLCSSQIDKGLIPIDLERKHVQLRVFMDPTHPKPDFTRLGKKVRH